MAITWLLPALELIGPHLGTIIKAATPTFTRKEAEKELTAEALLQQQVAELQLAASKNAANITELAAQLQNTVSALGQAAELADKRLRRAFLVGALACALSAIALALALFSVLTR